MKKRAERECDAGSLFTWHVPFFAVANRRAFARERRARVEAWCARQPSESFERRAVEIVTSAVPPSPALCRAALEKLEAEQGRHQALRALLLQRFALSVLDPGTARSGRRARVFGPTDAYDAAAEAFAWCEAAGKTEGVARVPDVAVELGLTLVRAALVAERAEAVERPLAVVAELAPNIEASHVRFHAWSSIAIARLALGIPEEALIPVNRAKILADRAGDLAGQWHAERIRAQALGMMGRERAEVAAHAELAGLAERVADDLDSTPELRRDATISALQARAHLLAHMRAEGRDRAAANEIEAMRRRVARARAAGDADDAVLAEFETFAN
ncbi:hypothetical protein QP880_07545 [Dermabacter hominis]|uniref:hypothetical protein n=1 Tax=Dermabacter hominis TaxID=36740 RepID=UPI00316AE9A5|nr:hypothetical protein [Dermabacter hominis]